MSDPDNSDEKPSVTLPTLGKTWPVVLILLIAPVTYLLLSMGNSGHQARFNAEYAKLPEPAGCKAASTSTQPGGIDTGFEKTTRFQCAKTPDTALRYDLETGAGRVGYHTVPGTNLDAPNGLPGRLVLENACCLATYEFTFDGLTLVFRGLAD